MSKAQYADKTMLASEYDSNHKLQPVIRKTINTIIWLIDSIVLGRA